MNNQIDVMWDDNPVDITPEANFIWGIANKLRGVYMPDKYGDVIIPMTIIRRLECALEPTKQAVVDQFKKNPNYPEKAMYRLSGFQFYNTSEFSLKELCNDADHIEANFKAYVESFSSNVQSLLNDEDTLNIGSHIKTMSKGGCLYTVVKAFSELDLSPATYDSIKMGYIFENLIGRFFQNVDAGQYYTGRDIIKMCVSLLIAEGCDDIFEDGKIITVCDQACGTGGMLSTAYSYLRHYNPTADVRLFGQEYNGVSHAIGLAEMLIKGQNAENFRHADTFKEDCFKGTKMRFLLENPPFGTPWAGKDAKEGQEQAVNDEYKKGFDGRWGAGLPSGGDAQLIFIQSAIDKMDDNNGRAAIIENGSPLFTGGTASGESQVRRWLLENDLIEAIVQMPTDLFYNTGISTYVWILSKNKRAERKGKIQLIDASSICHKLRKPLGNKKNEFSPEDRAEITRLYADFKEGELVKIYDNTEFIYKEYAVMQPLQRSYSISENSIENMLQSGALKSLWDDAKVTELEDKGTTIEPKEKKTLEEFYSNKPLYEHIIEVLRKNVSSTIYYEPLSFMNLMLDFFEKDFIAYFNICEDAEFVMANDELSDYLANYGTTKQVTTLINKISKLKSKGATKDDFVKLLKCKKDFSKAMGLLDKIVFGLSVIDKKAEIQKDKNGEVLYDSTTKDVEIVKWNESIDDYMEREVLPFVPDAKWFWEENLNSKNPVIKIGAEIPFTRYFYKYQKPTSSEELEAKFTEVEADVSSRISRLFGEV